MRRRAARRAALLLLVAGAAAAAERFGVSMQAPPPVPDAARLAPAVRAEHDGRRQRLAARIEAPAATRAELADAWGALGMWYHAYRYFDRARRAYRTAEALAPDDFRWPYYLALIHARRGEFNAAVDAYRRVLERRPDDVPALVRLAEIELQANRAAEVAALVERIRALDPDQPRALLLRAQLHLAREAFEDALPLLERARQLDPDSPQVHYLLATAHRGLGQREAAARDLAAWEAARARGGETALDDPLQARLEWLGESPQSRQTRARQLLAQGRGAAAVEVQRRAVAADPDDMTARINLGVTLFQAGDAPGAIEVFEEVLRRHPAQPPHPQLAEVQFDLCAVLETQGRLHEAEARCRASLRSDPAQFKANVVLARLLLRSGRAEASLPHFERAIARNPADPLPRHERALALTRAGRVERAVAALESDLEALPGDPLLQTSLARLLAAAPADAVRDGPRALALARAAHRRVPSVATAETLAMALAETGDFPAAADWQRSAQAGLEGVRTGVDPRFAGERLALYLQGRPCREPWVARETVSFEIPLAR